MLTHIPDTLLKQRCMFVVAEQGGMRKKIDDQLLEQRNQTTYLKNIKVEVLIKSAPSRFLVAFTRLIQTEIGIKATIGPIIVELIRIDPYKPRFETSVVNTKY